MESKLFWEKTSGSDLQQGDQIFDCPVPFFAEIPAARLKVIPKVKIYDLIVITQTCDLVNGKAEFDKTRRIARNSLAFEIAVSRTFFASLCQIFYARRAAF